MKRYIYGFGGISLELAEIMRTKNEFVSAFVIDREYLKDDMNSNSLHIPVISFEEYARHYEEEHSVITITLGEPEYRERLSLKLKAYGIEEESINLGAYVSSDSSVRRGTILHLDSVVSSGCSVGKGCLLNKRVIVGHDSIVGDYSVISPSAVMGGHVSVGSKCFIGLGACIRDRVRIGNNVIIGMGAVVTHDIEDESVAYGSPAEIIRRNETHKVFR